eukprot:1974778-Alexandrium_andersonii.AAC.1
MSQTIHTHRGRRVCWFQTSSAHLRRAAEGDVARGSEVGLGCGPGGVRGPGGVEAPISWPC